MNSYVKPVSTSGKHATTLETTHNAKHGKKS